MPSQYFSPFKELQTLSSQRQTLRYHYQAATTGSRLMTGDRGGGKGQERDKIRQEE